MSIVLGIDLGKSNLAFAWYDPEAQKVLKTIHLSVGEDYYVGIKTIIALIAELRPEIAYVEKPVYPPMAMKYGYYVIMVHGLIKAALDKYKVRLVELSPSEVKKYFTGSGKADKLHIQAEVERRFGLGVVPSRKEQKSLGLHSHEIDHEFDAIAIALTGFETR